MLGHVEHRPVTGRLFPIFLAELRNLSKDPIALCGMSPVVSRELGDAGLAKIVQLASPFSKHGGAKIPFLKITEAGLQYLAEIERQDNELAAKMSPAPIGPDESCRTPYENGLSTEEEAALMEWISHLGDDVRALRAMPKHRTVSLAITNIEQRIPQWMIERYGHEKARRIGVVAMVGGKHKTAIRNRTPVPFRDVLLEMVRSVRSDDGNPEK